MNHVDSPSNKIRFVVRRIYCSGTCEVDVAFELLDVSIAVFKTDKGANDGLFLSSSQFTAGAHESHVASVQNLLMFAGNDASTISCGRL